MPLLLASERCSYNPALSRANNTMIKPRRKSSDINRCDGEVGRGSKPNDFLKIKQKSDNNQKCYQILLLDLLTGVDCRSRYCQNSECVERRQRKWIITRV